MQKLIYSGLVIGSMLSVAYLVLLGTMLVLFCRSIKPLWLERLLDFYGWLSACPVIVTCTLVARGHSLDGVGESFIAGMLLFSAFSSFLSTAVLVVFNNQLLRKVRLIVAATSYLVLIVALVVGSLMRLFGS